MDDRQIQLRDWACSELSLESASVSWRSVAGDASARRYFRLIDGPAHWVCMDAPPQWENPRAFAAVQEILADAGIRVPKIYSSNLERGFMVLEDLGDTLLQGALAAATADQYYSAALDMLFRIQSISCDNLNLPAYDAGILSEELSRFSQWFCSAWLKIEVDQALFAELEERLVASAQEQPRVLVHLDFHSRNLLLLPDDSLATIDFQDARIGGLCYDLAGLLRDCYIRWPRDRVSGWLLRYRKRLLAAGRPAGRDDQEFVRWFDWIGLQRHLKVLGNFARLAVRDQRPDYLADMPLVIEYIEEVLSAYPEFEPFHHWLSAEVKPRLQQRLQEAGI